MPWGGGGEVVCTLGRLIKILDSECVKKDKALHELLEKIDGCGYFDQAFPDEEEEEEEGEGEEGEGGARLNDMDLPQVRKRE